MVVVVDTRTPLRRCPRDCPRGSCARATLRSAHPAHCPCPWAYPNKSFHACDPAMCGCPCPRHPGGGIHGQWNPCACPCPRYPAPCPFHSTTAASSTRQSTTRQGGRKGTHDNQKSRARGPSAFRILHTDAEASEAFCRASTLNFEAIGYGSFSCS